MTYCGEQTLVKDDGRAVQAISLRCRAWTCDHCAPVRKRQLMAQAAKGQPNLLITITHRRQATLTAAEAAARLAHAWRLVRLRAAREATRDLRARSLPFGPAPPGGWPRNDLGQCPRQVINNQRKIEFLAVFEQHKSGWPHLHILARAQWLGQTWLSLQLEDLIGSPIVHVTRIQDPGRGAAYACKYASKASHRFGTSKRYWKSGGYQIAPAWRPAQIPTIQARWERKDVTFHQFVTHLAVSGYRLEFLGPEHCWGANPRTTRAPPPKEKGAGRPVALAHCADRRSAPEQALPKPTGRPATTNNQLGALDHGQNRRSGPYPQALCASDPSGTANAC